MELKDIQELMKVLKEDIAELKVRYGKVKLTLTNSENTKIVNTAAALPKVTKEKKIAKAVLPAEEIVKSSNVGKIKLLSPKTGTLVKKGQILAKIKTMGIDNDVKATVNGTLKEVLVADGSAVDFAKELFKIEVN